MADTAPGARSGYSHNVVPTPAEHRGVPDRSPDDHRTGRDDDKPDRNHQHHAGVAAPAAAVSTIGTAAVRQAWTTFRLDHVQHSQQDQRHDQRGEDRSAIAEAV